VQDLKFTESYDNDVDKGDTNTLWIDEKDVRPLGLKSTGEVLTVDDYDKVFGQKFKKTNSTYDQQWYLVDRAKKTF